MLKGKLMYNCFAVRPNEDVVGNATEENDRNAGTSNPSGSALYQIASYVAHSCEPSASVDFPEGNDRIAVRAVKDIATGEAVTLPYANVVDVESTEERREKLAKGFRFKCECPKCGSMDDVDE
jgi:import receptor subunit TOM20